MVKTNKQRMEEGLVYLPMNDDIMAYQMQCMEKMYEFNNTKPSELDKRSKLIGEMFNAVGDNCYIEPPLRANWGGKHVSLGNNVYANFNLTLVDDANIYVGDSVMFAPNVTVATGSHPIEPTLRRKGYQYNKDVHIGNNVWIGAGAVILPGVTIGDNTVIGAGSIVTKDIPSNVVAVGNPCRVMRSIDERDRQYFCKQEPIDWDNLDK